MSDDPFDGIEDTEFGVSSDDDPLRDRSKDQPDDGDEDGRESIGDKALSVVSVAWGKCKVGGQKVRSALSANGSDGDAAARVGKTLTTPKAKGVYAAVAIAAVAIAAFAFAVQSRGLFNAIIYTMLFGFAATLFPVGINLFGSATPNSVGKLHLLLGAVAFDHHYLVQREHGWEWCPGDRGRVWIDDEWHDVGGEENYSVLGWRPFGILRYKDPDTWSDKRADTAGMQQRPSATRERDPSTDGGAPVIERGGIREVERPAISGLDGTWLLDLKRVMSNGVRKIGDVELIETAEEIIERAQVDDSRMGNAGPLVETILGVFLGIIAGYGYLFLSG